MMRTKARSFVALSPITTTTIHVTVPDVNGPVPRIARHSRRRTEARSARRRIGVAFFDIDHAVKLGPFQKLMPHESLMKAGRFNLRRLWRSYLRTADGQGLGQHSAVHPLRRRDAQYVEYCRSDVNIARRQFVHHAAFEIRPGGNQRVVQIKSAER